MMWRWRTATFAPRRWMQPKRLEMRGQPHKQVRRLCNLNFEDEAACAAATVPREAPQVVALACDFINPSADLAETPFHGAP